MFKPIITIFKYRELFYSFSSGMLKQGTEAVYLDHFWLVMNPLLMLGLYVFAFGVVFGGRFTDSPDESTLDYALGVFIGLNVLGLISGMIGAAPGIIVGQPNFVKKVVFPLEILPAAMTGALSYDLMIGFTLCLFGLLITGVSFSLTLLYLPLILGPVFLIALGISWFFSALGVFVRDVSQISSFWGSRYCIQVVFFIQPKKLKKLHPLLGNTCNGIQFFRSLMP